VHLRSGVVLLFFACGRPAAAPDDPLAEKLRHCPATVPGARTEIEDVEGGVALSVRVEEASRVELRRRARHLEDFTHGRGAGVPHGGGKGGGFMRDCPVVTEKTTVVAREIEGGLQLHVTPVGWTAEALRAETRRRDAALRARAE